MTTLELCLSAFIVCFHLGLVAAVLGMKIRRRYEASRTQQMIDEMRETQEKTLRGLWVIDRMLEQHRKETQ